MAASFAVLTVSASSASAAPQPLATTATTTTSADAGQSTQLDGLAVSGSTGEYDASVTVSTTHGTLSMTDTEGVTLGYPSTLSGGASITLEGSVADVNTALATVHLDGAPADSGTDAVVSISMTLGLPGAVWSPTNHHFYEYVPNADISWDDAEADATTQTLLGYTGYLASIPSAAVNSLIAGKVQSNVWIGAESTDTPSANPARTWKWVAGPLANTVFTTCSNFLNPCNVTGTNGQYTSWQTNEPNNAGGRAGVAHSGEWVGLTNYGAAGKWNDFPAGAAGLSGYIVEFGNSADGAGDFPDMSDTVVSSSSTVHFNGPPSTPSNVVATPHNGSAAVTWNTPADNGYPITGYTVTAYDPMNGNAVVTSQTCSSSPCTITGLTNQDFYYFGVYATNSAGDSLEGGSRDIAIGDVPDPPTAAAATAGDQLATVSWTNPTNDGGVPIQGYQVTASPGGAVTNCGGSPCEIDGLTNGTAYTFTVQAFNAIGPSAASASSANTNTVTPSGLPTPPNYVDAIAGARGTAVITFSGADGNGSPITGYEVVDNNGVQHSCAASPCTFTGLTNGNVYWFTVRSGNTNGQSSDSYPTNPIMIGELPTAPTNVTATGGDSQADVSFTAPSDDGGAAIDGYTVTAQPFGPSTDCASSPCTVFGLNDGTAYSFTVVAHTAVGDSAPSAASNSVTPASVPNPPNAISFAPGNGGGVASIYRSGYDGGAAITDYVVTDSDGGVHHCSAAGAADPLSCTLTGMTNGDTVTFNVYATNSAGNSLVYNDYTSYVVGQAPDAPTNVAVAAVGDSQVTLSFTAPSGNGLPITDYVATDQYGITHDCLGASSPCVVTGLSDGVAYNFTVHAVNAAGNSAESAASASVTPNVPGNPDAPTDVSAAAGDGQATVSFTPPGNNGGSAVTGYTVTSSPDGVMIDCAGPPCVVTGLTDGTAYTFTVHATNGNGDSGESAASSPVTPAAVPDAPTSVVAVAGDGTAGVAFTASAGDNGSPITGYTVTSSPGNITASCVASPCSVTGLTDGTAYTFTVHATNGVGDSVESAASATVTPLGPPSAPGAVGAVAGDGSAVVSFTAPASDGGSSVTGYTVSTHPGGATTDCASSPCTVTGLTNGSDYTFTVVATNAVGGSPESAASADVTPATTPGAPTAVAAAAGNDSATVTFTAPSDGGSAITGYTVTTHPGGATTSCASSPCTVTGLTNGSDYTFTVHAANAAGDSTESSPSNPVTPAAAPGEPTGISAEPGDGAVTVSFIAPTDDGGHPITGYVVIVSPGNHQTLCPGSPCVITGLANGTPYTVTVAARTAVADSAPSSPTSAVTPATNPGAPTNVTTARGDSSAAVSFDAPADNGGSAVTDYVVTTHPGGATTECPARLCTVTGLTNGESYTFTAHAVNSVGDSVESAPSGALVPAAAPAAPTTVTAAAGDGDGQATVSFTAPADGGSAITGYTVTTHPGGATTSCASSPCTVTGLTNGSAYTFTVHATNSVGDSVDSAASSAVTPAGTPDAPTSVSASAGDGAAEITFSAPLDDGGSAITGYRVVTHPGGASTSCASSPCVVTGLTNGSAYTFTVQAVNALGDSPESGPTAAVTPATTPGVPTDVSAAPGGSSATVTFTGPSTAGGLVITGYTVTTHPGGATTSCASSPCTVTGLTNGTAYTFTVHATNSAGDSAESSATSAVTPAVAPGVPTGVSVTSSNGVVTVSFTAPTDDGGHPITGYVAIASPGNHQVVCTGSPCTITGLTNGTAYTVTVAARTSVADSAPSAPSASITPATTPGVPTGLTAARGDESAAVSFVAPASVGGSVITGYVVTTHPGGATTSCVSSPCTVTGLTNGTAYTFTVHATNGVGNSAESGPTTAVTPAVAPGAPTGVQGAVGNGHVTVTFTAPTDTGGLPITGYTVTTSPGGATANCAQSPCLVSGLANGTAYTFTVHATNAVGDSAESSATPVLTPVAAPGVPTGVTVDVGDGQATVHFTEPSDTGGLPITSYQISLDGGNTWSTVAVDASGAVRTASLTALTNGTTYHLRVRAVNTVGHGQPSATIGFTPGVAPPAAVAAPRNVTARVVGSSIDVSFDRVTPPSGTTIARYEVSVDGGRTWRTAQVTGSPIAHAVVSGLARGKTYQLVVRAVGSSGGTSSSGRNSATVGVRLASPATPWFHDPLTAAQRRHEIAVPKHPASHHGRRRTTVATDRTRDGSLAVPVTWVRGHRLTAHEAVTMGGNGFFAFNSSKLTVRGRGELRTLAIAAKGAREIVCEGYSDYGGRRRHERALSVKRANVVCSALRKLGVHARMIKVGYGDSRPVVVARKPAQRAANRRVVLVVKR